MTATTVSLRIAYQGEPGSNSEAAIRQLFDLYNTESNLSQPINIQPIPCNTFETAFHSVNSSSSDCALIPFESSIGGTVYDNYDLIASNQLTIIAELQYTVHHCSMQLHSNTDPSTIKRVISHPQALTQCSKYIAKHYPNALIEPVYDTAGAAKMVSENQWSDVVCIASELASKLYQLHLIDKSIEDDTAITRFLLLRPLSNNTETNKALPDFNSLNTTLYKTSIVFTLDNKPGQLHRALGVFAQRDLDLSKIESRPIKRIKSHSMFKTTLQHINGNFNYIYFVDVLAHTSQNSLERALDHLGETCPVVRVLGSYPSFAPDTSSTTSARSPLLSPKRLQPVSNNDALTIGIIGFGTFGQFLSKTFVAQGHQVYAQSRSNYTKIAQSLGVTYTQSLSEFVQSRAYDVVILSVSILTFEQTVKSIDWSKLVKPATIVDVLSVKAMPKQVLLKYLPSNLDILCTHPMFGPESGKYSWKQLPFMYDKVRCTNSIADEFINIFETAGCRIVDISCEQHDTYSASTQFLTHTTGRILNEIGCTQTPIDTKGYTILRTLVNNTCADSFDLYAGLYQFNTHSQQQLDSFQRALDTVRQQLQSHNTQANGHTTNNSQSIFNPRVISMNESKTVAVTDLATCMRRDGIPVISLSVGEPIDPAPQYIIDAAHQAQVTGKTKYTAVNGLFELREAICNKLQRENNLTYKPDQIVVSNGAKQCIAQCVMALCSTGDEVIIPAPYWVSYPDMVTLTGGTNVIVQTTAENNWLLTPEQLEQAITPKTKLIILCTPSNPTGSVYTKSDLLKLCTVLNKHKHVYILSDEIYEHLLYDGAQHTSIATLLDNAADRVLVVNGASKAFAMTGYRLGYIAGPQSIISAISKIQGQITSCASSISQYAFMTALNEVEKSKQFITGMVERMDVNRHIALNAIKQMKYAHSTVPTGAFYVMLDVSQYYGSQYTDQNNKTITINNSEDMGVYILQNYHVALVPGSAFGNDNTLRISFSADPTVLQKAMNAVINALNSLQPPQHTK